jgi:hypothetical protein
MFGGGWGRLAARGEGSGGGDGDHCLSHTVLRAVRHTVRHTLFLHFFHSPIAVVQIFLLRTYVAGKATRTQGALRREGGPDCVLCITQSFALRSP